MIALYVVGTLALVLAVNELIRGPVRAWEAQCDRWARGFFRASYLRRAERWEQQAQREGDPGLRDLMLSFAADWRRKAEG